MIIVINVFKTPVLNYEIVMVHLRKRFSLKPRDVPE